MNTKKVYDKNNLLIEPTMYVLNGISIKVEPVFNKNASETFSSVLLRLICSKS